MGKYFTFNELCASETAKRNKIENVPDDAIRWRIEKELIPTLDDIREQWGSPIRVTSGFRCTVLNKLVGGSSTSSHKIGYAADLQPINGEMENFKTFLSEWAKYNDFDQIILEKCGKSEWIHFGLRNAEGKQRKQVFNFITKK